MQISFRIGTLTHPQQAKPVGLVVRLIVLGSLAATALAQEPAASGKTSYDYLAARLREQIEKTDWGGGRLACFVEDADVPISVFAQAEESPMDPMGVAQLVTAAAALETLGPGFRFRTELRVQGTADAEGTLPGGMVAVGSGDPSLGTLWLKHRRELWRPLDRWAKALKREGIKKVDGPIIGDDRAFDNRFWPPGWPAQQPGDWHYPKVSALNFNHNCIEIDCAARGDEGKPAACSIFPELPGYIYFANHTRLVSIPMQPLRIERVESGNLITITGDVTLGKSFASRAAIDDPARYFAEALRSRLEREGIEVTGKAASIRSLSPGEIPSQTRLIDFIESSPLSELAVGMVRCNLTLDAEVIFKTLGRKGRSPGEAATYEAASEAISAFACGKNLVSPAGVLFDGSGRSRINRISAAQVAALMRRMRGGSLRDAFEACLTPIRAKQVDLLLHPPSDDAGMRAVAALSPSAHDRMRLKLDSRAGGGALAGYVQTRPGHWLRIVAMVNGSSLEDQLLRERLGALALELAMNPSGEKSR